MSAISNARWAGSIQVARIGTQLLSLLILSRLLTQKDFGLVALAFAVSNLAMLIRDFGTAAAIVQRDTLDPQTTATAHWSNCAIGLALGSLLFLSASPIARLLQSPEVEPLLQWLAAAFPVLGSATVHQALLERASRFAVLARIEISAIVAGFSVAIIAAMHGAGAYSLVLQTLTTAIVAAIQLHIASDLRPLPTWSRSRARELWAYSGHLFAFNLVNYFSRNSDAIVIGRVLGAASLGPYSLAYRLMIFPLQNLTLVASRALFPVMSRTQQSPAEIGRLYLRTLSVISFVTAPLMAGLFALRETFVAVALGDSWRMVADVTAWLAPVGFLQSLAGIGGSVFMALGRTRQLFRLGVFGAALHLTAFVIGVNWGTTGVAAAYLGAALINCFAAIRIVLGSVQLPGIAFVRAVLPSLAMAALMAAVIRVADIELGALAVPPLLRLLALSAAGALLYVALAGVHSTPANRDVMRLFVRKA